MASYGEFRAALQEWGPLLEILLQPTTLSPVGAASHWLRSHGFSGPVASPNRTCTASRLWRLVPHLLASRVAVRNLHSFDANHLEQDKGEEEELSLPRKRNRSAIGNCMWMQTLPIMAQANILGFLDVEHTLFYAKDLEILALDLLSDGRKLNFWVAQAAQNLLNKMGCSNNTNQEELVRHYELPSWLLNLKGRHPVLPWMPVTLPFQRKMDSCHDNSKRFEEVDVPASDASTSKGRCHANKTIRQEEDRTAPSLQTPPPHFEGHTRTSEEMRLSTAVPIAQDKENASMISRTLVEGAQEESKLFEEEAGSISTLARSLRDAWLERKPTLDDLRKVNTSPAADMFFKILKPWEMEDDTVLSVIKVFLGKESGFSWSAQVSSYCLLPKLVHLEQPASRFLVSAVIEACKAHPRALIDALLIPLVLSEKGPTKAQCDVMNRVLKECLSDNHIFTFCGKIFVSNRRQDLPFPNPPFLRESFLSRSVIWSEPAWAVLQNAVSRPIELDIEVLEALIDVCGAEVVNFAKSLKFCNLLLCLLSKYGPRLKPFKTKLQKVAEQTETFMTKALMAKSLGL